MSSIFHFYALKISPFLVSSKGLKLTSYQVEPPSISFWWRFQFHNQYKALYFLQLRGGLKLQRVGWRSQVVSPPSPYLPMPLPHIFSLSFLSWLVPFMTPDSEPESRFYSNDIFPISSASNGAQKFQKGFPYRPPHLAGGGFSDWPEAYPLGYHPQPGSLLGSTHRMWGWLSCRALATRLKSQAAFFFLVALDFHRSEGLL